MLIPFHLLCHPSKHFLFSGQHCNYTKWVGTCWSEREGRRARVVGEKRERDCDEDLILPFFTPWKNFSSSQINPPVVFNA